MEGGISPRVRAWWRHIRLSRAYKDLFLTFVPRGRFYNWLFRPDDGQITVAGEHVLADLRDFCFLNRGTIFDTDPTVMARREGRREVAVRIINLLNLDEAAVQQLMEIDDGIGG